MPLSLSRVSRRTSTALSHVTLALAEEDATADTALVWLRLGSGTILEAQLLGHAATVI